MSDAFTEKRNSPRNQAPAGNKGRRFPPEVLDPDEVDALIQACSARAPTGLRNRALIAILFGGGLRCAEALALRPADVDTDSGTLRVRHGKGGRHRVVALDTASCALVSRWLDARAARGISGHKPLLCTLQGGSVSSSYVRALMPRLASKAGIAKRVHAHGLRHSRAAQMRRAGIDLVVIQRALGHRSLATTEEYVRHLHPSEVLDAMRNNPWG